MEAKNFQPEQTIQPMFPYDPVLCATAATPPKSIAEVLKTFEKIQSICIDGDGLKWFNWLYLQVTQAVETRVASGGFSDSAWLAELDVQFACLYLGALEASLLGQSTPDCWQTLFRCRNQTPIARVQFALAGINAHINHDLAKAIVTTCESTAAIPSHDAPEYQDYSSLNTTLDGIIESAKHTLHVRLLGDALPPASHLEDLVAAWGVSAARESAWNNAEVLWHLRQAPPLDSMFLNTLDGLTTVTNKGLLIPVP
jgi:Family of unknown function (DUF5995)